MPKSSSRLKLSAIQVQDYLKRRPEANTPELALALSSLGVPGMSASAPQEGEKSAPKPRRGVETGPIIASLVGASTQAMAHVGEGPTILSLWFEGARALSVNELFSILQYRKHETFRYKKAWRALVRRALKTLPLEQRKQVWFEGPTRLTVFRQGQKEVDLDSLCTLFKYALDSLRREGIIDDDNPNIIVEPRLLQGLGTPALGMRLEALPHWIKPDTTTVHQDWFGAPTESGQEGQPTHGSRCAGGHQVVSSG